MSSLNKLLYSINAILLAAVAALFFLPQSRIESESYQYTLTGLNVTLGTQPYLHVPGLSDADSRKLIDLGQAISKSMNYPKAEDNTDLALLGVPVLAALAALEFMSGAFRWQSNSLGARVGRDLRDCAIVVVVILFVISGVRGFSFERAMKEQNASLKDSIAHAEKQAAESQAEYTRMTGLPTSPFPGASEMKTLMERQIARIHKTVWFDLAFALSVAALGAAVFVRFGQTVAAPLAQTTTTSPPVPGATPVPASNIDQTAGDATAIWDAIKTRALRFFAVAEAKASEAVKAGKVEVKLHQEKSAVAACKIRFDRLAIECGNVAADVSALADETLEALRRKVLDVRQKMKESRRQRDAASDELGRIDRKANPTKAAELTAWIKAADASLRRENHDLGAIMKELGTGILSINLAEPKLAEFYRQRDEIHRQTDQHSANIVRLEQEQTVHKASLGIDIKKGIVFGAGILVLLVIVIWAVASLT